jgi:hypothetical protein
MRGSPAVVIRAAEVGMVGGVKGLYASFEIEALSDSEDSAHSGGDVEIRGSAHAVVAYISEGSGCVLHKATRIDPLEKARASSGRSIQRLSGNDIGAASPMPVSELSRPDRGLIGNPVS